MVINYVYVITDIKLGGMLLLNKLCFCKHNMWISEYSISMVWYSECDGVRIGFALKMLEMNCGQS